MRANGYLGGWVEFDGQFVTVGHGGATRFLAGKGVKRIHISQIASVQIKPAGPLVNGFIQFATAGGNERRSAFGRQTYDAGSDENSVVFRRGYQQEFEQLARAVEYEITRLHAPTQPAQQAPGVAEQINQLWQLFQQGALTAQEFNQQKAHLLGQPPSYPQAPPTGYVNRGPAPDAPQHPPGWR
jgi:hypothetical protein